MGIFDKIKNAIFGHKAAAAPHPTAAAATPATAAPAQDESPQAAATPSQPVDVVHVLGEIAAGKGNPKLDYQHSIVDLMKLLDLDPSLANREQLAGELGYIGAKDGSAAMNIWLHKEVMRQLEANGGEVPAALTQ